MPFGSELEGKMALIEERGPQLREEGKEPIRRAETSIRKLKEKEPRSNVFQ